MLGEELCSVFRVSAAGVCAGRRHHLAVLWVTCVLIFVCLLCHWQRRELHSCTSPTLSLPPVSPATTGDCGQIPFLSWIPPFVSSSCYSTLGSQSAAHPSICLVCLHCPSVRHLLLPSWGFLTYTWDWIRFPSNLRIVLSLTGEVKLIHAVQLLSRVWLFATPWTAACQASLSFTISWSLLGFMSIESVMLSNHLIVCLPLLLLPSFFPGIKAFSNELALRIRWPKYWSFSFSISPSNEYSGLIYFNIDWFSLFAVQGTLESSSTPQFESIDSSALSLLSGPTPTSLWDSWKNHSFDYMDLCRQSDISPF